MSFGASRDKSPLGAEAQAHGEDAKTRPEGASWRAKGRERVTFIFNPAGLLGDRSKTSAAEQQQEQDTLDREHIIVCLEFPFASFSYQAPSNTANKRLACSRVSVLDTGTRSSQENRGLTPAPHTMTSFGQSLSGEAEAAATCPITPQCTASQMSP